MKAQETGETLQTSVPFEKVAFKVQVAFWKFKMFQMLLPCFHTTIINA